MSWLTTFVVTLGLIVLFAPLAMLALTVLVLAPLAHLLGRPAMLARTTLDCPVSRRRVDVALLSEGGADHPSDVESCSLFKGGRVTCAKGCLAYASTGWAPSPMVPRFALVADDTVLRDAAARHDGAVARAA